MNYLIIVYKFVVEDVMFTHPTTAFNYGICPKVEVSIRYININKLWNFRMLFLYK